MNLDKINSIQISLMESQGNINEKGKSNYIIKCSAKLNITEELKIIIKQSLPEILEHMFEDVQNQEKSKIDSVGIWIDYGGDIIENSMKIQALKDIQQYGSDNINAIYELFKMSFPKEN